MSESRAEPTAGDPRFRELLDAVLHRIDRQELTRLARELVRIPSVYRPGEAEGNEERVARHLADYLEREGFEVYTEEVAPGRPNVWAVWEGERPGKTLLFEAHTDVVTEGRAEDWSHPPFAAERVGDRIYGRGACDTKGNLAAAVMAGRANKGLGVAFPRSPFLFPPVGGGGGMGWV